MGETGLINHRTLLLRFVSEARPRIRHSSFCGTLLICSRTRLCKPRSELFPAFLYSSSKRICGRSKHRRCGAVDLVFTLDAYVDGVLNNFSITLIVCFERPAA